MTLNRRFATIVASAILIMVLSSFVMLAANGRLDSGFTYFIIGLTDMAAKEFEEAARANPNTPNAHLALGMLELSRGNPDLALESFRLARETGMFDEAAALMGDVYRRKGQWDKARAEYEYTLERDPEAVRALFGLAVVEKNTNGSKAALPLFAKVTEIAPDVVDAYLHLGDIYIDSGDFASARETLEKGVRYNSRNAEIHYRLGLVYEALGQTSAALHEYDRTLQLDERHTEARTRLQSLRK